ncbi:MAG: AAA family ATPase, partial [Methyloceanibacter sp.]
MSTETAIGSDAADQCIGAETDAHAPPKVLRPIFEGMPDELKRINNWLMWRYLPPKSKGGKWRKVPFQPNGKPARSTDPSTWATFEECRAAYATGRFSGVGFVFDGQPDENGLVYAGVDFDSKAFAGEGSIRIAEWLDRLGTYLETSVSGEGLHAIAKVNPLASGISHGGIELYTSKRYFAMTGRTEGVSRPVVAAPSAFAALAQELQAESKGSSGPNVTPTPTSNVVPFQVPDWAKNGPAPAFVRLPIQSLADGLEPSIEEIRSAVEAIPPSAIASEPEWMKVARALAHTAAVFNKLTEPLWKILDTASRRAPGYNEEDNRRRFDRYIREALSCGNAITIATVYHLASAHGWQGTPPGLGPSGLAEYTGPSGGPTGPTGSTGASGPSNNTTSGTGPNAGSIPFRAVPVSSLPLVPPKRQWLHGTDLIRGAVTVLVAPGGRAKSTWLLACALACASGRELLGAHVFGGPLRVLCLSTEDAMSEMALRLRAAMKHYGLTDADVPGLYVIGADRWGLPLLQADGNRAVLDRGGMDALTAELDCIKPDVLIIDPLITVMGGVSANENAAAALLMGKLAALAATRRIAVALAHHAAKGRDPASAESAMGAASFINLARVALAIEPLEEKNAGTIGLPPWDAKSIFRVIGTKQNFAPPNTTDRWFRLVPVDMANAEPPIYVKDDQVAVVEPFLPGVSTSAFPDQLVRDALLAVDGASPPLSPSKRSSERYAAPVIALAIARHRGGQASELDGKAVLDYLMSAGLVAVADVKVFRGGKGSDTRKGLVLTAAGKLAVHQAGQFTFTDPTPRFPQTPATTLQEIAGGDPLGPPQRQGGV